MSLFSVSLDKLGLSLEAAQELARRLNEKDTERRWYIEVFGFYQQTVNPWRPTYYNQVVNPYTGHGDAG